jgi:hypothetical protein
MDYTHRDGIEEPSVIWARLEDQIAAMDPARAELVRQYRLTRQVQATADPRGSRAQRRRKLARIRAYAAALAGGLNPAQAAAQAGVSPSTGQKYDTLINKGILEEG